MASRRRFTSRIGPNRVPERLCPIRAWFILRQLLSAAPSRVSTSRTPATPLGLALPCSRRVFSKDLFRSFLQLITRHSPPLQLTHSLFGIQLTRSSPSLHLPLIPPLSGASASWPPPGKGAQTYFPIRFLTFNVTHSSQRFRYICQKINCP